MGSEISRLSSQDVANQVKGLGMAYHKYENGIIGNNVNGAYLAIFSDKAISDCFDDVGVTSEAHRTTISFHFIREFPKTASSSSNTPLASVNSVTSVFANLNIMSPATAPLVATTSNLTNSPSLSVPSTVMSAPSTVISALSTGSNAPSVAVAVKSTASTKSSPVKFPMKTMAFLTHDWGVNEDGTQNHALVMRVNEWLKAHHIITWFDHDRMRGSVQHEMTEGVDNADCIVAFVTLNYLEKVNSKNMGDNCCFEFTHAARTKPNNLVAVVVEDRMRAVSKWPQGLGNSALGHLLYIDLVNHKDPASFETSCANLRDEILRLCSSSSGSSSSSSSSSGGITAKIGGAAIHSASGGGNSSHSTVTTSNPSNSIPFNTTTNPSLYSWIVLMSKSPQELSDLAKSLPKAEMNTQDCEIRGLKGYYTGQLNSNNQKDGLGVFKCSIGTTSYEGTFRNDAIECRGIFRFADGSVHEGDWKDGNRNGRGILRFSSGDVYEGDWKDDNINGQGIYRFSSGDVYEGDWKDGNRNGQGLFRSASGDVYEGDWKDGNRNGRGILRFASGDVYEGDLKDDKKHGRGIFRFASGDVYEGDWKDDKEHGRGILRFSSGDVYEGDWKDDKKHGRGILRFADGSVYEGDWKDDKRNGRGILRFASGSIYEGDWKDDKRNGRGILRFASGSIYEGDWKDDIKHGRGKRTYKDGRIKDGMWEENVFLG